MSRDPEYGPTSWPLPPAERRLAGPFPEPRSGRFTGYGPKSYVRADTRILEDVCDRLTADPFVDATDIDVRVTGGEVSLEGVVRTRDQKRRAEDTAAAVRGVCDVNNQLRVEQR
jgi:osmotically-inducible protein OsmY